MTFVTAENSVKPGLAAPRPSWLERLDPRNSVGAATGWLIAAVSLGLALAASTWVSTVAADTLLALKYKQLNQYAERLSSQLDITLYGYLQSVRATAGILGAIPAQAHPTLRQYLDELQRTLPQFAWAGYVDASGRVVAATGGILEGQSVADRAWFPQGLKAPFIMDLRKAPMQQDPLPATGPTRTRYIALAAPIVDANGAKVGVVGVQMSWNWAESLKRKLDLASHPTGVIETFVVDRNGVVLLGPTDTVGHPWPRTQDHERYIDGSYSVQGVGSLIGTGWTVWVREPKQHALVGVAQLRYEIFTILFGLGLLAAVMGAWGARRVLRRIGLLAELADNVRNRDDPGVLLHGKDEAARIGGTLTALVAELQRDKAELQKLNAELDARVAARTREVERLSEENQYAAVIRERLRIARELHDTLAHSMMAMLTQVRLLRKFVDTNPEALKEELACAEEAAQSGLNEARAAIAQMRYNPVRDAGLDAAVRALAQRFEQRTGVATTYSSDAKAGKLADSRAETVFRMIEELLHNVERHAGAREVRIALDRDANNAALVVTVCDDGVGFDPAMPSSGHYGLRGLREQATLIGATLLIDTAPQHGVCATITLPLSPQD
jgi:signal transduction histidine kinase